MMANFNFFLYTFRYTCDSTENKLTLRHFLLTWFRSNHVKSSYLLNKFAYIINAVFLIEYPSRGWDNFFDNFLSLCQTQDDCNLFLRILLQINSDVADREIAHTPKVIFSNFFWIFSFYLHLLKLSIFFSLTTW